MRFFPVICELLQTMSCHSESLIHNDQQAANRFWVAAKLVYSLMKFPFLSNVSIQNQSLSNPLSRKN